MSKIISYSNWNAKNIPHGISFDAASGVFSGSPNVEAGEYVVPVSVQTNYGYDAKNVTIVVEKNENYPVYAIGFMAKSWSNNAEPDENGLYPLNIPKAYELRAHHAGFTAYTSGGGVYDCGIDRLLSYMSATYYSTVESNNNPILLSDSRSYETMLARATSTYSGSNASNLQADFWVILKNFDNKRVIADTSGRVYANGSTSPVYVNTKIFSNLNIDNSNGIKFPDYPKFSLTSKAFSNNGLFWLTNNGYSVGRLIFKQASGSSTNISYSVKFDDLDYRAIKIFDSTYCSFLSEELYLDGMPNLFTFGNIKDAWFMYKIGYVLTQNNDLYEYNDGSWTLLGNWPAKKIEILPYVNSTYLKTALMLTENGELFYKGPALNSLNGVCDAQDSFTRILPNCTIHDMTLCYPQARTVNNFTLTVLKE